MKERKQFTKEFKEGVVLQQLLFGYTESCFATYSPPEANS